MVAEQRVGTEVPLMACCKSELGTIETLKSRIESESKSKRRNSGRGGERDGRRDVETISLDLQFYSSAARL